MNILDFEAEKMDGAILKNVFDVVKEIFINKYKDYQLSVKDLPVPIDIDTYEGQAALKDYLEIRTFEEIIEMSEALKNSDVMDHVYEEVGDAFNFLINSYVLYGWDASNFISIEELWSEYRKSSFNDYDSKTFKVCYDIGLACNKLKIRPWKRSQYLTDILVFEERFKNIYYSFMELVFSMNIYPELLWSIFSRKNQCNLFRISTGY